MDMNALLQGAMQDPAARDFITQLLAGPDPRYAQMAQLAAQPRNGPDFSFMQGGGGGDSGGAFDEAYNTMDEMLKGFDPAKVGAPAAPGPMMGPPVAPGGAPAPAPAFTPPANPMMGYMEGDVTSSPIPSGTGFSTSLIDQLLNGLPAVTGVGPR